MKYNEDRKKLIKFFKGTRQRFKDPNDFEKNAKDFMNALFDSCSFKDEQMIKAVFTAYNDLTETLSTTIGKDNYEFYKFLKIIDCFLSVEYKKYFSDFIANFDILN